MKSINLRLLLILIVSTLVVAGGMYSLHSFQVRRNAGVFLVEGREAMEEGDLERALENLRWYLQLVPDDAGARGDLGIVLADLGMLRSAYDTLERALRVDSGRSDARRRLVTVALQMRRVRDARTHLVDHLLKENPNDGELLALFGQCEEAVGDFQAAADRYREAIANAPDQLETYARLANLLRHRLNQPGEADQWMQQLIDENPNSAEAHILTGGYLEGLDSADDALKHAMRALELQPEDSNALFLAARIHARKRDYDEAHEYAARAVEESPHNVRLYMTLAEIEGQQGRRSEAIAWIRRGLEANPGQTSLTWTLAALLIDDRQLEEAKPVIRQLEQAEYHRPLIEYLHARVLLGEQEWLAASRRFERTRPHLTDWPDLLKQLDLYLATCYQQLGDVDAQLASLRRAVSLDPLWAPARVSLAAALRSTGRNEEALEEYGHVMRSERAPSGGWLELARLAIMQNLQRDRANRDWREITRLLDHAAKADPENTSVVVLRAEVAAAQERMDDARRLLEDAKQGSPESLEIRLALAALAQRENDWDEAERLLQETREELGDSVAVRLALAQCWLRQHGADAAERIRALADNTDELSPEELPRLWTGLAQMSLQTGQFEHTREMYRRLTEAQPNELRVWMLLFDLAMRAEDDSDIEHVLKQIRRIEGGGPLWEYGTALRLMLLAREGRTEHLDEALDRLARVAEARPDWARVPLLKSQIYELRDDEEATLAHLNEAIELGERNPQTIRRAIELLARRQRFLEADRLIRRLEAQATPFSLQLGRLATEVSLALDDFDRALSLASQAAVDTGHYGDHMWHGQVLGILGLRAQNMGRTQEAETLLAQAEGEFRRAVELQTDATDAWVALIRFYGVTGAMENADKAIAEAQEAIPEGLPPLALGQCYETLGRTERAESEYQNALQADPDNAMVTRRVAEFYLRSGKSDEAEAQLRRIAEGPVKAAPEDVVWARRALAMMLADRGGYDNLMQGMALVQKNLARPAPAAEDRRAHAVLLASHPRRSQQSRAIGVLEELLANQRNPQPQDRFALARLYLDHGDWTNAARHMRVLLAGSGNDPRHALYVSTYVRALLDRGELREAELWLNQLERIAAGDFATVMLRVNLLVNRERYAEAVATLNAVLERPNLEEQQQMQLAGVIGAHLADQSFRLSTQGRHEGAERLAEASEEVYRTYLDRPGQQAIWATFLARIGRLSEAMDILEKEWETAHPNILNTAMLYVLQMTHNRHLQEGQDQRKQRSRLEAVLLNTMEKRGRRPGMLMLLADLYGMQGDNRQAQAIYREILGSDPRNVKAMNNLAMLLAIKGEHLDEAAKLIRQAIQLSGPVVSLLDTQASVLMAQKRPRDALAELGEIAVEGESANLQFRRAQAFAQLGDQATARLALESAHAKGLRSDNLHPLERPAYEELCETLGLDPNEAEGGARRRS